MIDFNFYVVAILVTYIPFHLFEEALGNFPLWMYEHGYTKDKKLTYSFWLAGNIFFFYTILLAFFFMYYFGGEKFIFAGLGILFWGAINFFEHLFYTIKDRKISPGTFTSFIFIFCSILGTLEIINTISPVYIVASILSGIMCMVIPIMLQIYVGNRLWIKFEE